MLTEGHSGHSIAASLIQRQFGAVVFVKDYMHRHSSYHDLTY